MQRTILVRFGLLALVAVLVSTASAARAGGDWNDDGIAWRSFEEGMAEAKKEGKPLCLIVYTEWCPHCTNYSRVFHDEGVRELSKNFVMVRLDQDQDQQITRKYAPDGSYVPRTLFFTAEGELDPAIRAARAKYVYFYDEHDPGPLREAMKAARAKHQPSSDDS